MKIKGALHIHSNYSYDAKVTLQELRNLFIKEGLSFALMTEHTDEINKEQAERFIAECRHLSDDAFVFIPGFEVPYKNTHILMIGAAEFFEEDQAEALNLFKNISTRVVLAHPHRNNYKIDSVLASVIDGVEIWNSQYDGKYVPRIKSIGLFKRLKKKSAFSAFAGWDFHREEHAGGPLLVVEVLRNEESLILNEIKNGSFVIEGKISSLRSDASFVSGGGLFYSLFGLFLVGVISFGKRFNKILSKSGIKPPKNVRRIIRKVL